MYCFKKDGKSHQCKHYKFKVHGHYYTIDCRRSCTSSIDIQLPWHIIEEYHERVSDLSEWFEREISSIDIQLPWHIIEEEHERVNDLSEWFEREPEK